MDENDEYPGYSAALKAAGAEVLLWQEFGSYQGRWVAKIRLGGKLAWVSDYYGSCSVCDALEAELGYEDRHNPAKLAAFGKQYLENLLSQSEMEEKFIESAEWSLEDEKALEFVREHRIGTEEER